MSLVAIAIFLSAGILTVSIAHFLWNYLRERENKLDKNALDLKIAPGSDTNNPRTLLLINRGKTVRNPEFTAHNQQAIRIDPPEHSKGGPPQQLRVWKTTYPARVRITHLVASESPVKFGFTVCYIGADGICRCEDFDVTGDMIGKSSLTRRCDWKTRRRLSSN